MKVLRGSSWESFVRDKHALGMQSIMSHVSVFIHRHVRTLIYSDSLFILLARSLHLAVVQDDSPQSSIQQLQL